MAAPVCQVLSTETIEVHKPIKRNVPPLATDLPSVLNSVNMLIQNFYGGGGPGGGGGGDFVEMRRVVEKVRVFNPDDNSQFVDIEQIKALTMADTRTGSEWTWKR